MPEPVATEKQNDGDDKEKAAEGGTPSGPPPLPEDLKPLFISSQGQEIYGCRLDKDVTEDKPFKHISKQAILDDFSNRAAVCDFHPVKNQVLNYRGDELLLVLDADFKYGQNFLICLSEETKESVLKAREEELRRATAGSVEVEEEEEEEEDIPEPSTVEHKPWVCLGSDAEIIEGQVVQERPLAKVMVSRKRRYFGAPVTFAERDATNADSQKFSYAEFAPYEDENYNLHRLELDKATQAVPEVADIACQTTWVWKCNAAVQCEPRSEASADPPPPEYAEGVSRLLSSKYSCVRRDLNDSAITDTFSDIIDILPVEEGGLGVKTDNTLVEYQSFNDLKLSKDKTITCIDWHPSIKGLLAVAYAQPLTFDERVDKAHTLRLCPSLILIWGFGDAIHPVLILEAPEDVNMFRFNPSRPNIVAGACINGQVVLWDVSEHEERLVKHHQFSRASVDTSHFRDASKKSNVFELDDKVQKCPVVRYCATSSIEHGHRSPVADLIWLPSHFEVNRLGVVTENKTNVCNQLMTCAVDSFAMIWDLRPVATRKNTDQAKEIPHPAMAVVGTNKHPGKIPDTFKHLDLTWRPLIKLILIRPEGGMPLAPIKLSVHEPHKPTTDTKSNEKAPAEEDTTSSKPLDDISSKFFVGTEDGEVVYADWKLQRDHETNRLVCPVPDYCLAVHCGFVNSLQRSPFFRDIMLSVGMYTFAIWKEGVKEGTLLQCASSSVPLTGGQWSLSRASVFFITKANGNIDVWDLSERSHEPTLSQSICTLPITFIEPSIQGGKRKQGFLALGDRGGTLHIVELPWNLNHHSSAEESAARAFFDREVDRLRYCKEMQDANTAACRKLEAELANQAGTAVEDSEAEMARMQKEYKEYLELEKKLLIQFGLREPDPDTD